LSWAYLKLFFIRTLTKITPYTKGKEREMIMEIALEACELMKFDNKESSKIPNNWKNAQQI
jgi:hypothetical protein